MGVIKKILFRGNILAKPRHRNLFLDMEENIHIHYRDLRVELSRGEFEDFANIFAKQSSELQAVIQAKNYQDGKLPNANQEGVRVWTESRLQHEVKYHPQRFALEECGDGYHLHYRNYKLLIDKDEFQQLARVFKHLDLDAPYASGYHEVIELLEANELDFTFAAGSIPGEVLAIQVATYHLPKVRDILGYIGFVTEKDQPDEKRYVGKQLTVIVVPDAQRSATDYRQLRDSKTVSRLADYLAQNGANMATDVVNQFKCQVLDFYFAMRNGDIRHMDINPESWLYTPGSNQVIFPYKAGAETGKAEAEKLYRAWSALLGSVQLGFIKPPKVVFPAEVQAALKSRIETTLLQQAAAFGAVEKIYLMGSAIRGDMGYYSAPFIHGKLAKLGSDIDVLVEIHPEREADIPPSWEFHLDSASNHCAIYHIAKIPMLNDTGDWQQRFPHIPFIPHLVDAYVYFPSRGYQAEKAAFLSKFKGELFYDRERDGVVYHSDEEARIAAQIAAIHGFQQVAIEKMKVSTENAIFKVFADHQALILKLFKVAGNYSQSRVIEHTAYEEKLVSQLEARGILTAGIVHAPAGSDARVEGFSALLFQRISGAVKQRPEYPLQRIAPALADIHRVQMEKPLTLEQRFPFDDTCMIWLPTFDKYLKTATHAPEISQAFADLAPLADCCHPGEKRGILCAGSFALHNHGDVTPKNVITQDSGEAIFFDFNNAFYGPRMVDIIDGAFEFSLAEKYIHLADFARFDQFIDYYDARAPLTPREREDLPKWIALVGIIKFTKEIRVLLEAPQQSLRFKRALAIAAFILSRVTPW